MNIPGVFFFQGIDKLIIRWFLFQDNEKRRGVEDSMVALNYIIIHVFLDNNIVFCLKLHYQLLMAELIFSLLILNK